MTRLKTGDIEDIASRLDLYDGELVEKTGFTLQGVACHALAIPEKAFFAAAATADIGVVPIRSGEGIIQGFSETVKHIVRHIGFKAFVTIETDVAGIAEAVERNAEIIMMADDERFIALNIKSSRIVDNAAATAKGYIAGLDLMVSGLKDRDILVIGCGPVGRYACMAAIYRGANVAVYDINHLWAAQLARDIRQSLKKTIQIEYDLRSALKRYQLLIDATDAARFISEEFIQPSTFIAAPGLPLGITPGAAAKLSSRLLHDPLQIGTAVMAVESVLSRTVEDWRVMLPYGTYFAYPIDRDGSPGPQRK
jgi:pyrrolysine biosynthesis protein PylD